VWSSASSGRPPPLHIPRAAYRDGRHDGRGLCALSEQLGRLSVPELTERERTRGPEAALSAVEVLEQFGAVRDRTLEPKGRLIASLRHDNELLVAEAVSRRIFFDLTSAEAAAVCSALMEESRSGEAMIARTFLRRNGKLRRKVDQLIAIADSVFQAQRARHLAMPISVQPGFMRPSIAGPRATTTGRRSWNPRSAATRAI
jgi:hypothetical protein